MTKSNELRFAIHLAVIPTGGKHSTDGEKVQLEKCDAVTIFRDGRTVVSHKNLVDVTREQLVSEMVGREIKEIYDYRARTMGAPCLDVQALEGRKLTKPASLTVRQGEIRTRARKSRRHPMPPFSDANG